MYQSIGFYFSLSAGLTGQVQTLPAHHVRRYADLRYSVIAMLSAYPDLDTVWNHFYTLMVRTWTTKRK